MSTCGSLVYQWVLGVCGSSILEPLGMPKTMDNEIGGLTIRTSGWDQNHVQPPPYFRPSKAHQSFLRYTCSFCKNRKCASEVVTPDMTHFQSIWEQSGSNWPVWVNQGRLAALPLVSNLRVPYPWYGGWTCIWIGSSVLLRWSRWASIP